MSWDYSQAFVKYPQKAIELLASRPTFLAIYSVLLNRARYHAGPVMTEHGPLDLDIGQSVYGRDELAIASGSTPSEVRTAIKHLRRLGFVATKSTNRGTVATLLGFKETYQPRRTTSPADSPTDSQHFASQSPALRQQLATNSDLRSAERDERAPTAHSSVSDHFSARFKAATGKAPTWGAKERAQLDGLLKSHDAAEINQRIDAMLALPADAWPKSRDFATLAQHFDKFVGVRGVRGTPSRKPGQYVYKAREGDGWVTDDGRGGFLPCDSKGRQLTTHNGQRCIDHGDWFEPCDAQGNPVTVTSDDEQRPATRKGAR